MQLSEYLIKNCSVSSNTFYCIYFLQIKKGELNNNDEKFQRIQVTIYFSISRYTGNKVFQSHSAIHNA